MKPVRIIWHHSAARNPDPQFMAINDWHKARNFPLSSLGFYVGYHYVIERDGVIKQARKEDEIGAHDQGENLNSIGICLAGDFTAQLPTDAQRASVATLVREITQRWNIPITRIEPHRWDDDTACPGAFLPDNWLIKTYLTEEGNALMRAFWWIGEYLKLL